MVNLATGADGALTQHRGAGDRRAQRRPGRERARDGLHVRRQRRRGHRPGDAVAQLQHPATGTTGTPTFASTKVRLSDYLRGGTVYWTGSATATPPTLVRTDARHITKGPFDMKVYRIGKDRTNNAVGVFLYCQQHAREWVTPITCVETAERLVRNYATDPTTKEYVDKLNIFILPSVNPDGGHYAFHDGSVQRKNMKNYCPITTANGGIGQRASWGVDLNRNNTVGTLFDGYDGASTSCMSEVFTGLAEASEAGDQERALDRRHVQGHQVREQHPHPRRLLHVGAGRVHRRGSRDAAGAEHRRRAVLLRGRGHDPVAHPLLAEHGDPAAARRPDRRRPVLGGRQLGRRELLQARHHRLLVRGRRAADRRRPDDRADHTAERRLPAVLRRARAPMADRAAPAAPSRLPTRCWSTRATTPRWSSPRATSA